MPVVNRLTTLLLRNIALLKSYVNPVTDMPNSSARLNKDNTSAFLSRDLVGIQPQLRQTPPRSSFSNKAVRRPS